MLAKPSIIIVGSCVDTSRAFRGSPLSQPRRPLRPNELAPPTAARQVLQSTADVLRRMYLSTSCLPRSLYWVFLRDMEQWLALATELSTASGNGRFDCGALGLLSCVQLLGLACRRTQLLLFCLFFFFFFFFDAPDECLPPGRTKQLLWWPAHCPFLDREGRPRNVGSRTPPGTAHVCLFESALVIVIPGGHCSRRSTAWTWCRRVGRTYRVLWSTSDRYQPQCFRGLFPHAVAVNTAGLKGFHLDSMAD